MGGTLVVTRDYVKDIKIRGLFVYLDDAEVANLAYGRSFTTELTPGSHKLKVTNTLFTKEAEFEVKEGETVTFQAGNYMTGLLAVLFGWAGIAPYKVLLERKSA